MDIEVDSFATSLRSTSGKAVSYQQLFPVLASLESPVTSPVLWVLTPLCVAYELVQFLGFVVNPYFAYDTTVVHEFMHGIYATHIPVWDATYHLSFPEFLGILWFVITIALTTAAILVAFVLEHLELKRNIFSTVLRFTLHGLTVFVVPAYHVLLSGMVCKDGALQAFPSEKCWQTDTGIYFAASLVALLCAVPATLVVDFCIYEPLAPSQHLLARPHSRLEAMTGVSKFLLVLFFHTLLMNGHGVYYCVIAVLLNAFLFAAYSVVHPFYNSRVTYIKAAAHFACAVAALVSIGAAVEDVSHLRRHKGTQWLVGIVPLSFVIGYYLSTMRPNPECIERIEYLRDTGVVYKHKCRFPRGLPVLDTGRYEDEVGRLINEEATMDEGTTFTKFEVVVPYVSSIFMATDIELATRFLRLQCLVTGNSDRADTREAFDSLTAKISPNMLGFASRIIVKGLLRFWRSPIVHLHMAIYVKSYCSVSKYMFAIEQCELANTDEADISTRFQAHQLCSQLRLLLGMQNRDHLFSLQRARRFHKEALLDMSTFWLKLMDTKHDLMTLITLANQITERRDRGNQEYLRAIRDSPTDRTLLASYASFLETVMLDKKQAEAVQARVSELAEEVRRGIMGSRASKSSRDSRSVWQNDLDLTVPESARTSHKMPAALLITSTILVAMAVVNFVLQSVNKEAQLLLVDKMLTGARARTLVQMAANHVNRLKSLTMEPSPTETAFSLEQDVLRRLTDEFSVYHNKITFGPESTGYSAHSRFFREPLVPLRDFPLGTSSVVDIVAVGLWSLGSYLRAALVAIASPSWVSSPMKNRDLLFALENIPTEAAWAYNYSLQLCRDEDGENQARILLGSSLVLALVVLLVVVVNFLYYLHLKQIGLTKIITLHLFSLIPHPTQDQLHKAAKDKIVEFDKQRREEVKGTEDLDADLETSVEMDTSFRHLASVMKAGSYRKGSIPGSDTPVSILKRPWRDRRRSVTERKRKKKKVRLNLEGLEESQHHHKLMEPPPVIPENVVVGLSDDEKQALLQSDGTSLLDLADETTNQNDKLHAHQKISSSVYAALCLSLLMMLVVAQVSLVINASIEVDGVLTSKQQYKEWYTLLEQQQRGNYKLRALAIAVPQMGYTTYWTEYWQTLYSADRASKQHDLAVALEGTEVVLMEQVISLSDKITRTEKIALTVAAEAWDFPDNLRREVKNLEWSPPANDIEAYKGYFVRSLDSKYSTREYDLANSPLERSRAIVTSDRHLADQAMHRDRVGDLMDEVKHRMAEDVDRARKVYLIESFAIFALLAAILVLLAVIACYIHKRRAVVSRSIHLLLGGIAVTTLVVAALLIHLFVEVAFHSDPTKTEEDHNATKATLYFLSNEAQLYIAAEDPLYYYRYWQLYDEAFASGKLWEKMTSHDGAVVHLEQAKEAVQSMLRFHLIAMRLVASAANATQGGTVLPQRTEHTEFEWDHASESSYSKDLVMYATDTTQFRYTSSNYDLARPPEEQVEVARQALFSQRYYDVMGEALAEIDAFFDSSSKSSTAEVDRLIYAVCALSSVVAVAALALVTSIAVEWMSQNMKVIKESEHIGNTLFSGLIRRCQLAYLVVVLVFAGQYILGYFNLRATSSIAERIDIATGREWAVSRSSLVADQLIDGYTNGEVSQKGIQDLTMVIDELKMARNRLYFGSSESEVQLNETEGAPQYDLVRMYNMWINSLQALSLLVSGGNVANVTAEQVRDDLEFLRDSLIQKLWAAGDVYADDGKEEIRQSYVIYVLVTCGLILIIVLEYEFVFRPVVRQLNDEENGTKVLLKMIPVKVRELVPKIAAYLEHGIVVDEKTDEVAYPSSPLVKEFIGEMARDQMRMENCCSLLDRCSYAVLLSDDSGTIIYTNSNWERLFGFRQGEVLGSNVRIIVPDALAGMHNSFIESYKATGIARVIGSGRDLLALHKSGKLIHAYMILDECRRGPNLYFIAQFSKYVIPETGKDFEATAVLET